MALRTAVILAGGKGTRLSEETVLRPKPLVEIGGKPILWHIMKIYHAQGVKRFVICLGYKGYMIKEYFANYSLHQSDVTIKPAQNEIVFHRHGAEDWEVTLIDTGLETQTGGRLKRAISFVGDEDFYLTYGDGVGDIDLKALDAAHAKGGGLATVSVVAPAGRFGAVELSGAKVTAFREKPANESGWINGGFFALSPKVIDYLDGDDTVWEREPLERLAAAGLLHAHRHNGFWQPMDTLRDMAVLERAWSSGAAPWRIW
ncbi:MAG: glucose-1-phosphate cytidylyltransferase [Terricaulis sp.]